MTPLTHEQIANLRALAEATECSVDWYDQGDFAMFGFRHESFCRFMAACDPQTILALCALAAKGLDKTVTDAMVLRAQLAYDDAVKTGHPIFRAGIRAALESALSDQAEAAL